MTDHDSTDLSRADQWAGTHVYIGVYILQIITWKGVQITQIVPDQRTMRLRTRVCTYKHDNFIAPSRSLLRKQAHVTESCT